MRAQMRSVVLLTLLVLGLAAAAVLWLGRSDRSATAETARPDAAASPSARSPLDATHDPADGAAAARVAAPVEPPPPPPREPGGIEEDGAQPLPTADFSWKYAELGPEELERLLAELEGSVQLASDKEILQRFEDGRFVEREVDPGDPRALQDIVRSLAPADEIHQTRIVMDPASVGAATVDMRAQAVQIVSLPRDQFPGLYALADERDWLRRFLAPVH